MKQLTIRINDELHHELKTKAVIEKKPMTRIIIELVKEYIKK